MARFPRRFWTTRASVGAVLILEVPHGAVQTGVSISLQTPRERIGTPSKEGWMEVG